MHIDLTQSQAVTLEAVRNLLASGNPGVHNQLRVSDAGLAYLSTAAVGGVDIKGLRFRLETWAAGSACVGQSAAEDEAWVRQIRDALLSNWPNPASDYIDMY